MLSRAMKVKVGYETFRKLIPEEIGKLASFLCDIDLWLSFD
jgi:hypothetical protein